MFHWNWSFRLGRLFRTDILIHWTLPVFFLFYILRGVHYQYSWLSILLFILLPYLFLFASVVAHEFGHVFAARRYGNVVGYIVLTPIGGAVMIGNSRTPKEEFVVAAAGPAVNLFLSIAALGLYWLGGGLVGWELLLPFSDERILLFLWAKQKWGLILLYDFIQTQVFLLLFNLLMLAYPMDGGRIFYSILWKKKGREAGLKLACEVAKGFSLFMGLVGIVFGMLMLVVIGIFIWLQADQTLRQLGWMAWGRGGGNFEYERPISPSRGAERSEAEEEEFQKRLDEILDKINRSGLSSLTWRERRFLKKASRKYKNK
ncbi:MAG: hypothetical protein D6805_00350 [Planctomycetota bacterium]|nr:MAG: hypothetical protein D6805_00350 [Planctomycetota bacterium]